MRLTCPECGGYFISAAMESVPGPRRGDPPRAVALDSQWCNTEGCKHNLETGEPYGTGERVP